MQDVGSVLVEVTATPVPYPPATRYCATGNVVITHILRCDSPGTYRTDAEKKPHYIRLDV
jgi:hypothetical protein